jgi:hypothetical protein
MRGLCHGLWTVSSSVVSQEEVVWIIMFGFSHSPLPLLA